MTTKWPTFSVVLMQSSANMSPKSDGLHWFDHAFEDGKPSSSEAWFPQFKHFLPKAANKNGVFVTKSRTWYSMQSITSLVNNSATLLAMYGCLSREKRPYLDKLLTTIIMASNLCERGGPQQNQ
jgi:hypothetical protein